MLLLTISCEKELEIISISEIVDQDRYYEDEIFRDEDLKIYGTWESMYSYGGFAGTYYEPSFDYLEVVKYGIYGIINNNEVQQLGRIEIISQEGNVTTIDFIYDEEYSSKYHLSNLSILFKGNDTLLLAQRGMSDGYTAYFKRIN